MAEKLNNTPLSYEESEYLCLSACNFFSGANNEAIRKELGLPVEEGCIRPLSGWDFYHYLQKIDEKFSGRLNKIRQLLPLLERKDVLQKAGTLNTVILGECYYYFKELTACQQTSLLWFGDVLGLGYIQYKLSQNVIHITGITPDGNIGNGTGFLINNKTVLTCKHVVENMVPDETVRINGKEFKFEIKKHHEKDVALLVLEKEVENTFTYPVFNSPALLDDVLVMGYPPIPTADSDYLLSLKGEVNSIIYDYLNKTHNLILSSTTRPGNSGGPVLSRDGYLVGMVIQFSLTEDSTDETLNIKDSQFPFYMAMCGDELFKYIKEIEPDIDVLFEDYQ